MRRKPVEERIALVLKAREKERHGKPGKLQHVEDEDGIRISELLQRVAAVKRDETRTVAAEFLL